MQVLAIELYKTVDDTAPQIIKEVFKLHEGSNCNLRHFIVPRINTVYHGIESASFLVSKFGDRYPQKLKEKVLSQNLRKQ